MRWIPVEVFVSGEPCPHPPGTAVRRRLRAVPLDPRPVRTWLAPSVNGVRMWRSVVDRRAESVVGEVWVRRTALRWRRLAWSVWVLVLGAAVVTTVAASPGPRPDPADRFAAVVAVLILVALVLIGVRVRAFLDDDRLSVGIRE